MTIEKEKIYQPERTIEGKPEHRVSGFASPAKDFVAERINLNQVLIPSSSTTYIYRTSGDEMVDLGIRPGAIVVFDARLPVSSGDVVVARIGEELHVRIYKIEGGRVFLKPENTNYEPIELCEDTDFEICGTVTNAVNGYRQRGSGK